MTHSNEKKLQGTLEKIIYANTDNGFTVARLRNEVGADPVTVVGHLSSIREGEQIEATGFWQTNKKFGNQFHVLSCKIILPSTIEGLKKYLSSGLIKGIGPVMAERIVRLFGEKALDIFDHDPRRLREVKGIGKKTFEKITSAWNQQRDLRETMIFLQGLGITPAYAGRIVKEYGNHASEIVRKNPYQLTYDIHGIGFKQADAIAMRIGVAPVSPERAAAAAIHTLNEAAAEGHVFMPVDRLFQECAALVDIGQDMIEQGLELLVSQRKIMLDRLTSMKAAYLMPLYASETGAAKVLKFLRSSLRLLPPIDAERAANWFERKQGIKFNPGQHEAIRKAVENKLLIITGGPGTGKTTIIRALVEIFRAKGQRVALAAPTGRAAKRMETSAGIPAMTIHRLLEFSPANATFLRDQANPIECSLLIIDEASMLDITLLYHLLKAVPSESGIIFIGDIDQLPSVGPGNVLADLIQSGFTEGVRLSEIFRQEEGSLIILNAHRINHGEAPVIPRTEESRKSDFHFIERSNPDEVVATIEQLVCHRIPEAFQMDPLNDIQVLSPMHKGTAGVANLNSRLQHLLNGSALEIEHGSRRFRTRDKVMQIRNDYEKEVFNGDIGFIFSIDTDTQQVSVDFDGRIITYEYAELDELDFAYAISVHKSQGSEYRAVVMPVVNQHYVLLQRNLLYTAVTRARELVVLVGTTQALSLAIKNVNIQKRNTLLAERLKS